jgi:integrase
VGIPPPAPQTHPSKFQDEVEYREFLREKGNKESTIETKVRILRNLNRRTGNLWDSAIVTVCIKASNWGSRRKNNGFYSYRDWCNWKGFDYTFKKYRGEASPLPYIPSEKELDQLIAYCKPYYSSFLQVMNETAFRPGEVQLLRVVDVDFERGIINLTKPLKWSNPRQAKISNKLVAMITRQANGSASTTPIWPLNYNTIHRTFFEKRKQLAQKLENPNFMKITFKTFRHWKATMEYSKTKDILHVKKLLGHKEIKNTLIYTHLVNLDEEDSYTVRIASNMEEFTSLLENGFEFVSDYEDKKILRKRK